MRVYGLTGGIASGKTEAANRLRELGIPVIDADKVGHELIQPGGAAANDVIAVFGEGILTEGAIDRSKLGAKVFSDSAELDRLNAIIQPAIKKEIARQISALAAAGKEVAVIDAALIGEGGKIASDLAGLILILASLETRAKRLVENRGLTREQAIQRIESQTPPESKIPLARWVVQNETGLADLRTRMNEISHEL